MPGELCQSAILQALSWWHPRPSTGILYTGSVEFLGKESVLPWEGVRSFSTSSGPEDVVLPEETHNLSLLPLITTEGKTVSCYLPVWKLLTLQNSEDHLILWYLPAANFFMAFLGRTDCCNQCWCVGDRSRVLAISIQTQRPSYSGEHFIPSTVLF